MQHTQSLGIATAKKSLNQVLTAARANKRDEFYTRYEDIEKEVEVYVRHNANTFRGKVVYCNCDNAYESNFFRYFAVNFNRLGLKRLTASVYDASAGASVALPLLGGAGNGKKAEAVILSDVREELTGDGDIRTFLKLNRAITHRLRDDDRYAAGDFRSADCVDLLRQADMVVTNPPFSLFREYVAQLVANGKRFLVMGTINAVKYNSIFPLIRSGSLWGGVTIRAGDATFHVPDHYEFKESVVSYHAGKKHARGPSIRWWTNIEHGHKNKPLKLMTMAENLSASKHKELRGKKAYDRYCNYDAIEVPFTDAIPSDYDGMMGVPITFFDKYCPEQFELIDNIKPIVNVGSDIKYLYARLVIRHRRGDD